MRVDLTKKGQKGLQLPQPQSRSGLKVLLLIVHQPDTINSRSTYYHTALIVVLIVYINTAVKSSATANITEEGTTYTGRVYEVETDIDGEDTVEEKHRAVDTRHPLEVHGPRRTPIFPTPRCPQRQRNGGTVRTTEQCL